MIDKLNFVLTFISAIGSGLIAGFFLAFSIVVMKALGQQPPSQGIAAMQSINVVVLNPIFFTASSFCCWRGINQRRTLNAKSD